MTSSLVIVMIIVAVVALVAYAFVSQTMQRKREQRDRLLSALKMRIKDFRYLASGFPPGFLPAELALLVHRCLVEVLEQLIELEPKVKSHSDELTLYSKQFQELKTKGSQNRRVTLDNPQQIKEVKGLLKGLTGFLHNQHKRGKLNAQQLAQHEKHIQQLLAQIMADGHLISAKQAQGSNKARLALHYYTLAKKLITKGTGTADDQQLLLQVNTAIAELEEQLAQEASAPAQQSGDPADPQASQEWDQFGNDDADDMWKKKNVYD